MLTAGVDLATDPASTGLAVIEWFEDVAVLRTLTTDVLDRQVLDVVAGCDKVGIDCPFGWPEEFLVFATAHARGRAPLTGEAPADMRARLAFRETDRFVYAAGTVPLSVVAERLGRTAMRMATLLAHLDTAGTPVDRTGSGVVCEVYPAASMRQWDLPAAGYKSATKPQEARLAREVLLSRVLHRAPWLQVGEHEDLLLRSHDALDALVCALTARAAALGGCSPPPPQHLMRAAREGWIALPDLVDLSRLLG